MKKNWYLFGGIKTTNNNNKKHDSKEKIIRKLEENGYIDSIIFENKKKENEENNVFSKNESYIHENSVVIIKNVANMINNNPDITKEQPDDETSPLSNSGLKDTNLKNKILRSDERLQENLFNNSSFRAELALLMDFNRKLSRFNNEKVIFKEFLKFCDLLFVPRILSGRLFDNSGKEKYKINIRKPEDDKELLSDNSIINLLYTTLNETCYVDQDKEIILVKLIDEGKVLGCMQIGAFLYPKMLGQILLLIELLADITTNYIKKARINLRYEMAAKRLEYILNNFDSFIFVLDIITHRLIFSNKKAKEFWPKMKKGFIFNCRKIFPNVKQPEECPYSKYEKERGPIGYKIQRELHLLNLDPPKDILLIEQIIPWEFDRPALLILGRDITEEKKSFHNKLISQRFDSLSILAGGLAHDFNNLLGVILGNLNYIEESLNKEISPGKEIYEYEQMRTNFSKFISEMKNATKRGSLMAERLQNFSRGYKPKKEKTDLQELIQGLVVLYKNTTPNIIFKIECESNIPKIEVDPIQINQVIQNILKNAIEAMPDGGTIVFSAKIEEITEDKLLYLDNIDTGMYFHLSISDSGVGMTKEELEKISTPFYTTKEDGHGLGTVMIYRIIKSHHGTISYESKIGKGTTVHIYLPIDKKESKNKESLKNIKDKTKEIHISKKLKDSEKRTLNHNKNLYSITKLKWNITGQEINKKNLIKPLNWLKVTDHINSSQNHKRSNYHILVMDDDFEIRLILKRMLEYLGFSVVDVKNGNEAIEIYLEMLKAKNPFNLIFLDLDIRNGLNGLETIKILRKIDKKVPIICASGYFEEDVFVNWKKYGFSEKIQKPFSLEKLKNLINKFISFD